MPERPSSSAAGATTWRLTESPELLVRQQALSLRQSLLLANVAGFLGGYFVLHNQWLQLSWGLILATLWLLAGGHEDLGTALKKDRWMQAVGGVMALMMLRSTLMESPGATLTELWKGWGNSFLLFGFLLTLWQAARLPNVISSLGKPVVAMASVAALVSLVLFYTVHPEGVFGASLRNCLVFGGWNSVCTGLTFGFAACWASMNWDAASERKDRRRWLAALVILMTATLFSLSRGALLAFISAHLVLLLVMGWRRSWRPVVAMMAGVALFQASAPLLSDLAAKDASKRLKMQDATAAVQQYGDNVVKSNPLQAAVKRSDNGRFIIYGAVVNALTTPQDWLLGKGLWAEDDCWTCSLFWTPEHTHSVFWDTLVHSGVPGLLAVLGLAGWGGLRAIRLARAGEPVWLMLAGFGLTGLLFDGDTVWALVSVSRFEPLLFWTPLVIASSRFTQVTAERASA